MDKNIERRSLNSELSEVRTIDDSRIIEGYGIIFNTESRDLGNGLTEVIKPEAVDGVFKTSDVFALMNHKMDRGVLARSNKGKGSLELTTDKKGVKYRFKAPSFDLGNELVEGVKRGDIRSSSFSFIADPKGESIERRSDGSHLRTITKFQLIHDMSPCYIGAYEDTTVALRNLEEFRSMNSEDTMIDSKSGVANTTLEPIEDGKVVDENAFDKIKIMKEVYRKLRYSKR